MLGKIASWKCVGMAQRVLGGTVAMQVGTRRHYESGKIPWKWGVGTSYDSIPPLWLRPLEADEQGAEQGARFPGQMGAEALVECRE